MLYLMGMGTGERGVGSRVPRNNVMFFHIEALQKCNDCG